MNIKAEDLWGLSRRQSRWYLDQQNGDLAAQRLILGLMAECKELVPTGMLILWDAYVYLQNRAKYEAKAERIGKAMHA